MSSVALKVDVDTLLGTQLGVPRLARLLEACDARATFLFSVGPDHTGRAIRRVFRRGFLSKVRRTSVRQHYGMKTLLYGTLLPGPAIGRRAAAEMRAIAAAGFDVGLHCFDHVRWQDGVAGADRAWAARELERGIGAYEEVFGTRPTIHGAAGWQINADVPALEAELGFRIASDTRGTGPFLPATGGIPQLPTTLPTLDELLGREDLGTDPVSHLLGLSAREPRDHVYTLHAEIEGQALLSSLEALIRGWRAQGYALTDLQTAGARLDVARLPRCTIVPGTVAGRSGTLARQGPPLVVDQ